MFMRDERDEIVKYGAEIYKQGLTHHTLGYLAYYNRSEGAIAVSPSAVSYLDCTPEDVVVVDIDGNPLDDSNGRKKSTEWPVIQALFRERDDFDAIVHTHSRFATTLSTLRIEVPATYFELATLGGSLRCTDYHLFTKDELATDVLEKMKGRKGALIGNHGQVACGDTLEGAYRAAELIELCCEIYWRARCIGDPVPLSEDEIVEARSATLKYHQKD